MLGTGSSSPGPSEPARGNRARRQGPVRHRRPDDDLRLGDLRRARADRDRRGGAPPRGGRLRERRQDEPARVRLRDDLARTSTSATSRTRSRPGRRRRVERRLGGRARRRARRRRARHGHRRLDPDPGRVLRRRRLQADLRARLARGLLPARAELDHAGPMARTVEECTRDDAALAPGFERADARLARGGRGRRRLDGARRPARPRAGRGGSGAASRAAARSTSRSPTGSRAVFMREVADDAPRALRRERRRSTATNVATKIERCLRGDRRRVPGRRSRPRGATASDATSLGGTDLLVTPTLPIVAPPAGSTSSSSGAADALHLAVQRARRAGPGDPVRPGRGRPAGLGPDRRPARRRRARARGRRGARARAQG